MKILSNVTYFFEILPLLFCLLFFKKINTKQLKVFFIYTFLLATFIMLGYYLLHYKVSREYFLLNIRVYILTEYALLSLFFFFVFKNRFVKRLLLFSIIPFSVFCILNYMHSEKATFNNKPLLVEFLLFIIIIAYFFFEKMRVVTRTPLYQSITFWLCVGLFIYFTGNFFYLLFLTDATDKDFIKQMKIVYTVVTITKDILLAVAWFAQEKIETEADELQIPKDIDLDDDLSFTLPTNP